MSHIRLIGDVHGILNEQNNTHLNYLSLISEATYSVQVGDLGFNYLPLKEVDSKRHRVIAGNHDNYDSLTSHFLGDFGNHSFPLNNGSFNFFFYRGANSPDWQKRTDQGKNKNWWKEEEVSRIVSEQAFELYKQTKPSVVISHECPAEVIPKITSMPEEMQIQLFGQILRPSLTNYVLQACFDFHKPDYWVFGHYHRNRRFNVSGTEFICLDELSFLDINEAGVWSNQ